VHEWLARHPRWTCHFTPALGSWLNPIETFFSAVTRKRIRRGRFHSVVDLEAAIKRYLAEITESPSFSCDEHLPPISSPKSKGCLHPPYESVH
jgi:transposase